MRHTRTFALATIVLCLFQSSSRIANGDFTFQTIANFNGNNPTNTAVTLDAQGNIYGTTEAGYGGQNTVYEIAAGTGKVTTLATFPNQYGSSSGVTLDAQGNIYGTTYDGGAYGSGSVFKIAAGTGTVSTVVSFGAPTNSGGLFGGLTIDSRGNIYGTTTFGGTGGNGTVFEIAAGTSILTTLASFGSNYGSSPHANLTIDAQGNIYSTTLSQGAPGSQGPYGNQTVFKLAAGSSTISTLATFNGTITGDIAFNSGVVLDSHGNIYGTTFSGGAYGYGTVFEIAAGTNILTTLASFTGASGRSESGLTIDAQGNLFGSTYAGTLANSGTVFEIAAGTSTITTLTTFTGLNGAGPSGLTMDAQGDLFGTTFSGPTGYGTVFELVNNSVVPEPASIVALGQAIAILGISVVVRARSRRCKARGTDELMK